MCARGAVGARAGRWRGRSPRRCCASSPRSLRPAPRPICSARSRWSRRGRSAGVNCSRRNMRTTSRSPATARTSPSTARSPASPGCGGATSRTGALEQVAGGDAEMPSISETGQYVSFTTNEGRSLPAITDGMPVEAPTQEAVNVYVRNMAVSTGRSRGVHPRLGGERLIRTAGVPRRGNDAGRECGRSLGDQRQRWRGGVRHDRGLQPRRLSSRGRRRTQAGRNASAAHPP